MEKGSKDRLQHAMETQNELGQFLAQVPKHVRRDHRSAKAIRRRIRDVWGDSLDVLVGLFHESRDLGEQFLQCEYEMAKASNDLVFFATMHLHANACLVTSEVLTLLEAGFSSGATARWRSLYEIAVYAAFIVKHGPNTAERYLRHAHIKDWEDTPPVEKLLTTYGGEGFSSQEHETIEALKTRLLKKYGDEFKGGLGWAKEACPKKGGLVFKDIAEDVDLGGFESFYRTASHFVHPNWKGILDNEGLPPDLKDEALLAGASEYGIWMPAMLTARSLYGATASFLSCRKDSLWLQRLVCLGKLVEHTSLRLREVRDSTATV